MKESIIQRAVLDFLAFQRDVYFFRSASGAIRSETGRMFKTGKPGVPDITLCYQGRFIGLEIKTPTGRQSDPQKQAQLDIQAAGGEYYIIRSLEDVWKIFNYAPISGRRSIK